MQINKEYLTGDAADPQVWRNLTASLSMDISCDSRLFDCGYCLDAVDYVVDGVKAEYAGYAGNEDILLRVKFNQTR